MNEISSRDKTSCACQDSFYNASNHKYDIRCHGQDVDWGTQFGTVQYNQTCAECDNACLSCTSSKLVANEGFVLLGTKWSSHTSVELTTIGLFDIENKSDDIQIIGVFACPKEVGCSGIRPSGQACADGYEGLMCYSCSLGFMASSQTKECEQCVDSKHSTILVAIYIFVFCIAVSLVLRSKNIKYSAFLVYRAFSKQKAELKMLISTYQILSLIGPVLVVQMPHDFVDMLEYFGALINPNFMRLLSPFCISIDYYEQYIVMLLTVVGLVIMAGAYTVVKVAILSKQSGVKQFPTSLKFSKTLLWIAFLVYPMICNKTFQYFSCHVLYIPDDSSKISYMKADYTISCQDDSYIRFRYNLILETSIAYFTFLVQSYDLR